MVIFKIICAAQVTNGTAIATILCWRNGMHSDGRLMAIGRALTESPAVSDTMALLLRLLQADIVLSENMDNGNRGDIAVVLNAKYAALYDVSPRKR